MSFPPSCRDKWGDRFRSGIKCIKSWIGQQNIYECLVPLFVHSPFFSQKYFRNCFLCLSFVVVLFVVGFIIIIIYYYFYFPSKHLNKTRKILD